PESPPLCPRPQRQRHEVGRLPRGRRRSLLCLLLSRRLDCRLLGLGRGRYLVNDLPDIEPEGLGALREVARRAPLLELVLEKLEGAVADEVLGRRAPGHVGARVVLVAEARAEGLE